MAAEVIPSPNHGERTGERLPDMILLHYTGMTDTNAAIARLCAPDSEVSAHYVVREDGHVIQCVPENLRAWHAGESFWANETDINSCSIGIEIANAGHDYGYPDFSRRQIAAVIALCRGIIARRHIPADRVLGHSDVAPSRKRDPGEKFPWHLLQNSGVGHWVGPVAIVDGPSFAFGDNGVAIADMKSMFAEYGYQVSEDENFDESLRDVVTAFQGHFRPARVDGIMDFSTMMTLRKLLDARGMV